ncbi:MAG: SusC/RagA family TonB-linked outer membrane protein [Prevotella sp.]|nr:SusC/RagA family TonB-linked outer membrane protein [Prevotella sp.]
MKHKIFYMSALMALSSVTPAVAQNESDSTQVNVAFRTIDKQDMLGGISVIDMQELSDKAYDSYSLRFVDNVVGGFNGNIWGNTEYLVVVDGMVRDANNVLPTEIDQITLLKGAQAVVLYGPRAAKGAILITTKRGKTGDLRINVHANTGFYTPKDMPKYLGSAEYMSYYNQARLNDGLTPNYTDADIYHFASGENPYRYPNFNMYSSDYIKKAYSRYEGILEVTGGTERMKYYTTTGYYRESSLLKVGNTNDNYTSRFFVRGNIDVKLNNFLSVKADANVTFYDAYTANTDWWGQAATLRPNMVSPLIPISYIEATDKNSLNTVLNSNYLQGDYFLGGTQANPTNPYAAAFAAGDNKYVSRQFQFNTEFDVNLNAILKGLMFRARYGIDYASTYNQGYSNEYATFSPSWTNYSGQDMIRDITQYGRDYKSGQENISNSAYRYTYNVSGQFEYANTFAEKHNFFGMLVANLWQTQRNGHYHRTTNANLGLQLSYNYDHTYYVDFSAALPYSTKLPEGNRSKVSPVLTLGWRPTKDVLKDTFVDDLMLTTSYGVINQDLDITTSDNEDGYYLYKTVMQQGGWYSWGDNGGMAATEFQRGNNFDMTYVKRKEFTIGLRGSMWNKLITFDFNFFTNKMDGGLTRASSLYPNYFTQVGYPSSSIIPYVNFNVDNRTGIDFSVYLNKKIGQVDMKLGVSGMWYKSTADKRDENYEYAYQSRVGQALNGLWGLQAEGLFQTQAEIDEAATQTFGDVKPGDIRYKDQNGDGKIDATDEVFLGRWDSPFMSGINLTLKWKNFTFFTMGNLYLGGHGMKSSSYFWMPGTAKYSEIARECWTPETAETAIYPRLTTANGDNNYRYSDYWMYSNDRFTLRKVQLTYTFPAKVFANTFAKFVRGLDVYVAANDLLTIAKERKLLEMNVGSAPQTRYYSIGLKASF